MRKKRFFVVEATAHHESHTIHVVDVSRSAVVKENLSPTVSRALGTIYGNIGGNVAIDDTSTPYGWEIQAEEIWKGFAAGHEVSYEGDGPHGEVEKVFGYFVTPDDATRIGLNLPPVSDEIAAEWVAENSLMKYWEAKEKARALAEHGFVHVHIGVVVEKDIAGEIERAVRELIANQQYNPNALFELNAAARALVAWWADRADVAIPVTFRMIETVERKVDDAPAS